MSHPASDRVGADQPQLVSFDPATGDAVGSVPLTAVDSIPRLVHQAREAQRGWGALTHA